MGVRACIVSLGGTPLAGSFCCVAASPFATVSRSNGAEKAPLAIKGYDPVAYFTDGKPERGLPEIEYEWDEHRYRFSRAEHRELSRPILCATRRSSQTSAPCLWPGAMIVEADPENWLISDGKLYLFGKSIGPDLFREGSRCKRRARQSEPRPYPETLERFRPH